MTESKVCYKARRQFKYTPGPWWVEYKWGAHTITTGEPGGEIGTVPDLGNAVLIAEAPRLYEAALLVLAAATGGSPVEVEVAIDALRKVVQRVDKMKCVIRGR